MITKKKKTSTGPVAFIRQHGAEKFGGAVVNKA